MNQAKPQKQIIQQGLALDAYLRTLLDDVPAVEEALLTEDEPATRIVLKSPAPQPVNREEVAPVASRQRSELVQPENQVKLQALSVMPEWAQQEFQALFLKWTN